MDLKKRDFKKFSMKMDKIIKEPIPSYMINGEIKT